MNAPFVQAIYDRGWEAFPLLQDIDADNLTQILVDNLQVNSEIHKFIELFKAPYAENPEFFRGMIIGITATFMAQKDASKLPMFLHQCMMMVAIMASKNVDILTGGDLKELNRQRFGREN